MLWGNRFMSCAKGDLAMHGAGVQGADSVSSKLKCVLFRGLPTGRGGGLLCGHWGVARRVVIGEWSLAYEGAPTGVPA